MHARLEANALRDWRPGWRTAIAHNIASTSDIAPRKKRGNAVEWAVCVVLAAVALAVAVYG